MSTENSVGATNPKTEKVGGPVDKFEADRFAKKEVPGLHPKNESTRHFAVRKGTRPPRGTDEDHYENIPHNGSWGFLKPGESPLFFGLHDVLICLGLLEG